MVCFSMSCGCSLPYCGCFTEFERRTIEELITANEPGKLIRGGMAEWSIAAVLKTAGLTAPGVRIPLPPLKAMTPFCLNNNETSCA